MGGGWLILNSRYARITDFKNCFRVLFATTEIKMVVKILNWNFLRLYNIMGEVKDWLLLITIGEGP